MAAGARRVVVRRIFMRIERAVVLIELIGLVAVRLAGLLGLVAHPVVSVSVELMVGLGVTARHSAGHGRDRRHRSRAAPAGAAAAGNSDRSPHTARVPPDAPPRRQSAARGRRPAPNRARCDGDECAAGRARRELRERIVLPDQSGQLGERIAAAGVVALARRAPGAPRGIVRSVGSQRIIVRHTHSVSGTGAALGRFWNVPHSGTERDQRISSGASTPSNAKPGRENDDYALHESKTSQSHLWIILDNEA